MFTEENINILFNENNKTIRFVDKWYLEREQSDSEEILATTESIEEANKIVSVVKRFVPNLIEEESVLQ